MHLDKKCPECEQEDKTHWLSTKDQWQYYCSRCDVRFNDKGDLKNDYSGGELV